MTQTSVEGEDLPSQVSLSQNYPNPFNPTTTISFSLPQAGLTRLAVYNMQGQLVGELVNTVLTAGNHHVQFDASRLPSGIYMYRLMSGSEVVVRKMVLLK
jgi:hypothetical protein